MTQYDSYNDNGYWRLVGADDTATLPTMDEFLGQVDTQFDGFTEFPEYESGSGFEDEFNTGLGVDFSAVLHGEQAQSEPAYPIEPLIQGQPVGIEATAPQDRGEDEEYLFADCARPDNNSSQLLNLPTAQPQQTQTHPALAIGGIDWNQLLLEFDQGQGRPGMQQVPAPGFPENPAQLSDNYSSIDGLGSMPAFEQFWADELASTQNDGTWANNQILDDPALVNSQKLADDMFNMPVTGVLNDGFTANGLFQDNSFNTLLGMPYGLDAGGGVATGNPFPEFNDTNQDGLYITGHDFSSMETLTKPFVPMRRPTSREAPPPRRPGPHPPRANTRPKRHRPGLAIVNNGKGAADLRTGDNAPSNIYRPIDRAPTSWGMDEDNPAVPLFRYTRSGEWEHNRGYTAEQILRFILGPQGDGRAPSRARQLTVWVQATPDALNDRYPSVPVRCRWVDCPVGSRTIQKGQYRVAFDERPETSGLTTDPFACTGYMHLYCLEQCMALIPLIRQPPGGGGVDVDQHPDRLPVRVRPDDRVFARETCNPTHLGGRARDEAILDVYEAWCRRAWDRHRAVQAGRAPPPRNRDCLYHALMAYHLGASNSRKRGPRHIHLSDYMGDLTVWQRLKDEARMKRRWVVEDEEDEIRTAPKRVRMDRGIPTQPAPSPTGKRYRDQHGGEGGRVEEVIFVSTRPPLSPDELSPRSLPPPAAPRPAGDARACHPGPVRGQAVADACALFDTGLVALPGNGCRSLVGPLSPRVEWHGLFRDVQW